MDVGDLQRAVTSGHRTIAAKALKKAAISITQLDIHAKDSKAPVAGAGAHPLLQVLWEALLKPTGSGPFGTAIASSASQLICSLVQSGVLPFLAVLNAIIDGLPSVPRNKTTIVIKTAADLLLMHVDMQEEGLYECPFGFKAPRAHPFISIMLVRPERWNDIVSESKRILKTLHASNVNDEELPETMRSFRIHTAYAMMEPFFRFVFVSNSVVIPADWQSDLLQLQFETLSLLLELQIPGRSLDTSGTRMHECPECSVKTLILSTLEMLPITRLGLDKSGLAVQLLHSFAEINLTSEPTIEELDRGILISLSLICDLIEIGDSMKELLPILEVFLIKRAKYHKFATHAQVNALYFVTLSSLSYVLLNTPGSSEEIGKILRLLELVHGNLNKEESSCRMILRLLIYPLIQIIIELESGDDAIKARTLLHGLDGNIIAQSDVNVGVFWDDESSFRGLQSSTTGVVGLLVALTSTYLQSAAAMPENLENLFLSSIPLSSTLFLSGLLFADAFDLRVSSLNALKVVVQSEGATASNCMTMIPLMLYILQKNTHAEMNHDIIFGFFSAISTIKDPYLTSRNSKIALSLVGQDAGRQSSAILTAAGLRLLCGLWVNQQRLWAELKGALSQSVLRVERAKLTDVGEAEVQLATGHVLITIGRSKAKDYVEEIIPLVHSLLNCRSLLQSTVTNMSKAVASEVSRFYGLVASKADGTDVYLEFKMDIISNYIVPMMQSPLRHIKSAGYDALSKFPATDMYPLIAEPTSFVAEVLELSTQDIANVDMEFMHLLTSLIKHEVQFMRRAVFKGIAAAEGVSQAAVRTDADIQFEKTRSFFMDTASEIKTLWDTGRSQPGNRPGLAAFAMICCSDFVSDSKSGKANAKDGNIPFAKQITNALRDLSFSDDYLLRLEIVPAWKAFWESQLLRASRGEESEAANENRAEYAESLLSLCVVDLFEKRLKETRVPSIISNIFLALAGLLVAASELELSNVHDLASSLFDEIIRTYLCPSPQTDAMTDIQRSDEAQFAIIVALGYISCALHPTDIKRLGVLAYRISAEVLATERLDDTMNWYLFGCGLSLTIILESTLRMRNSAQNDVVRLLATTAQSALTAPNILELIRLGIALGLPASLSLLKDSQHASIIDAILLGSTGYLTSSDSLGQLETVAHMWVVTGLTRDNGLQIPDHVLVNINQAIESSQQNAISVCHNRLIASEPNYESRRSVAIEQNVRTFSDTSLSTARRIKAMFGLLPLLNLDYGDYYPSSDILSREFRQCGEALKSILLAAEPKASRIAGWIFGKLMKAFLLVFGIGESSNRKSSMRGRDPLDFRRLNTGSSFLKAAFDALNIHSNESAKGHDRECKALLTCLQDVDIPLPLVDWGPTFSKLAVSRESLCFNECFAFVAKHSSNTSSKSLVNSFLQQLKILLLAKDDGMRLITNGLSKLYELSGFRHRENVSPEVDGGVPAISPDVTEEFFRLYLSTYMEPDSEYAAQLQYEFLRVSDCYLTVVNSPQQNKTKVVLASKLKRQLLERLTTSSNNPEVKNELLALRCACSLLSSEKDILDDFMLALTDLNALKPKSLWCLCLLIQLAWDNQPQAGNGNFTVSYVYSALTERFVSLELDLLSLEETDVTAGINGCLSAVSKFFRPRPNSSSPTWDLLGALVKFLDVVIILCASSNGTAVEIAWFRALTGLVSVANGSLKDDDDIIIVGEERWDVSESDMEFMIPTSIQMNGHQTASVRKQAVKRLVRLLQCTTTTSVAERKGSASGKQAARVLISEACRHSIRSILFRLRDHDEVKELWVEVFGE
ncbi:hypothetical protein HDU76_011949 [Blyttiomyces sp. JEL0837]|nr:hypothetical protein HDU76_011949 [Blyttiomyces sp. JEL0837]